MTAANGDHSWSSNHRPCPDLYHARPPCRPPTGQIWWMRPIALIANGAMMASTPIDGGHYFIDLIAGIAVAVLAIMAAHRMCRRVAGKKPPARRPSR